MLIDARNAMLAGEKPYLKRLQYIESTGIQYVDTGIGITKDCTFSIRFRPLAFPITSGNSADVVCGARQITNDLQRILIYAERSTNYILLQKGGFQTDKKKTYTNNTVVNASISATSGEINGTRFSLANTNTPSNYSPMIIFGQSIAGVITANQYPLQVFSFSMDNGTRVCNLIPVLSLNGEAKMFDLVTNTYPAHYGTFVAGPDVAGGGHRLKCSRLSQRRSWRRSSRSQWRVAA